MSRPDSVAEHDATPPVLRFAMRVIDAVDHAELARVCVDELVGAFRIPRARVLDAETVWSSAGEDLDERPSLTMALRLSPADQPPVRLEVGFGDHDDPAIVRQQLLDLVGMVRRAWSRLSQLERERTDARRDALTGLDNRRAIEEWLDGACLEALHLRRDLTVMLVDLDHFKRVNDTHGHPAGDEVLQLAAVCFRAHLRPGDRVCRWGGDEFLIALPGVAARGASGIAERLREAFARDARARGCTMTIGIADLEALGPGEAGAASIIALADGCLLGAKQAGRNCVIAAACLRDVG